MSRKIYATVEGTIDVTVRVQKEIIIIVDEGVSIDDSIRDACGLNSTEGYTLENLGELDLQDDLDQIDGTISCIDETLLKIDNIVIDDSK